MDYLIKPKLDLIEEVVFYASRNIYEDRFILQEEIDLIRHHRDLLVIIITSFLKKTKLKRFPSKSRNKDIFFIRIFNSIKFKNVQQMYHSKALKWSKNKFAKIYETYKLNIDFPVDRRHSYSQSIMKMTEAAKKYLQRCDYTQ